MGFLRIGYSGGEEGGQTAHRDPHASPHGCAKGLAENVSLRADSATTGHSAGRDQGDDMRAVHAFMHPTPAIRSLPRGLASVLCARNESLCPFCVALR